MDGQSPCLSDNPAHTQRATRVGKAIDEQRHPWRSDARAHSAGPRRESERLLLARPEAIAENDVFGVLTLDCAHVAMTVDVPRQPALIGA